MPFAPAGDERSSGVASIQSEPSNQRSALSSWRLFEDSCSCSSGHFIDFPHLIRIITCFCLLSLSLLLVVVSLHVPFPQCPMTPLKPRLNCSRLSRGRAKGRREEERLMVVVAARCACGGCGSCRRCRTAAVAKAKRTDRRGEAVCRGGVFTVVQQRQSIRSPTQQQQHIATILTSLLHRARALTDTWTENSERANDRQQPAVSSRYTASCAWLDKQFDTKEQNELQSYLTCFCEFISAV